MSRDHAPAPFIDWRSPEPLAGWKLALCWIGIFVGCPVLLALAGIGAGALFIHLFT